MTGAPEDVRASLDTGLDRLLAAIGRGADAPGRYALLAHHASVTADLAPAHLALAASPAGPPAFLLGPEHGYYGVEQDMVPAVDRRDPWTRARIVSLYGASEATLRPDPEIFRAVDVLVIDLQDVGARYYTYAATAIWAARAAAAAGVRVWILDRPNPLGGAMIEGNLPEAGYESFVGAFRVPVRHGLTLGELARLEARRDAARGEPWGEWLTVWRMAGWHREMDWDGTGRTWIAPSPNMPTARTADLYPGGCLLEATALSEGRGTTRPFHLVGAPGVDPPALARVLDRRLGAGSGVTAVPTYFRPQFQKHAGELCGGVELVVTDRTAFRSVRAGALLLAAFAEVAPETFAWRADPYEFVDDRPAIDLLAGTDALRVALERILAADGASEGGTDTLDGWISSWSAHERRFLEERSPALLYPEPEAATEMGDVA